MRLFLLVIILLVLSGCSTLYHKNDGLIPEGYSDKKISETEYLITIQTYKKEDWKELLTHLLHRAAEVGMLNNYSFFSITDLKKRKKTESQEGPVTHQSVVVLWPGTSYNVPVTKFYGSKFKIRTLSAIAKYSKKKKENQYQYSVKQVINEFDVR